MTESQRYLLKFLAFSLAYPDAAWFAELGGAIEALHSMDRGDGSAEVLHDFMTHAADIPPLELQEIYTSTFDLEPATSLNLTYHLVGDSEDRGKLLAALLGVYRREGFVPTGREFPDFLPLVLEFLGECPEPEGAASLAACLGTVSPLAERLRNVHNPYAGLLGLAATLLRPYDESATTS